MDLWHLRRKEVPGRSCLGGYQLRGTKATEAMRLDMRENLSAVHKKGIYTIQLHHKSIRDVDKHHP
jgi:hypothetical protein